MPKRSVRKRDTHVKRVRTPKKQRGLKKKDGQSSNPCTKTSDITTHSPQPSVEASDNNPLTCGTVLTPLSIDVSCSSTSTTFLSPASSAAFLSPSQLSLDSTDISLSSSDLRSPLQSPNVTSPSGDANNVEQPQSSPVSTPILQEQVSNCEPTFTPEPNPITPDEMLLLHDANQKIQMFLNRYWFSFIEDDGIHVVLHSRKFEKAIQRRLFFDVKGGVQLSVHCVPLDVRKFIKEEKLGLALNCDNVGQFVDNVVQIVNTIRELEICTGVDHEEYKCAWNMYQEGKIDENAYQECRYQSTIRSKKCTLLLPSRRWRCISCGSMQEPLKRRAERFASDEAHPCTPDIFLTDKQKATKSKKQKNKAIASKKRFDRLQEKMNNLLAKDGVSISTNLSKDLEEAPRNTDLSPMQSLFIQQQLKAASVKNPCSLRWHPVLIRFALDVYTTSPATLKILRESGMIKLPTSRTLFDYAHYKPAEEGIDYEVLKSVSKKLDEYNDEVYKRYHVLMADEMHISKNLVYNKRTGEMIGFVKLSEVKKEIKAMMRLLEGEKDCEPPPERATKILTYMIKGVSTSIKEAVASFTMHTLTAEDMYTRTWQVITVLERSGIRIAAFVSDGNAVNRAFYKMNKPVTRTQSGIVFDTINKAAPHRNIYFLSDLPHLIKTIRNCFYNSGVGPKKKRCMYKNGQKIEWKTIIRLFNEFKGDNLRRSYKLNLQNVYPDSYTCMKVKYAFQVLSNTVSTDLADMNWPGTSETVKFIKKVNDFADQINGPHSTTAAIKLNDNLASYKIPNDPRFEDLDDPDNPDNPEKNTLMGFLRYLQEWKEEAEICELSILHSTMVDEDNDDPGNRSLHAYGDDNEELTTPAKKKQLSSPNVRGH